MDDVRPAATVMLVRESAASGIEVFMLRRTSGSAFAPDAYVFPGGVLDERDLAESARAQSLGIDAPRLRRLFRAQAPTDLPPDRQPLDARRQVGLLIAALRELFEESGVLIACTPDGAPIVPREALDLDRRRLQHGDATFAEILAARGWLADTRPLSLFSHWITPRSEPRRYDVHFFVAPAPPSQKPVADAAETHDGIWIAPAQALALSDAGDFLLIYPTRKHLERLRGFDHVDDLLAFAKVKPILTVLPSGNERHDFTLPADLEGAW